MKITVATTFSPKGYTAYAHRMVNSFIDYWPKSVELYAYYDELPTSGWQRTASNVHYVKLDNPDLLEFKNRNQNNPKQKGDGSNKNFLFDGIRFSYKVFGYIDVALNKGADIAIWLDGDVITHSKISESDILVWLDGKMAGALLRPWQYTETGFHIFDMRHPQAREFMQQWREEYTLDKIWNIDAGHTDCHTYDTVMARFPKELWNNLSPRAQTNHPFINGVLGKHMDHTKGPRKDQGKSKKSDMIVQRNEPYWQNVK